MAALETVPSSLIWNLRIRDFLYDSPGRILNSPLAKGFRFGSLGMHCEGTRAVNLARIPAPQELGRTLTPLIFRARALAWPLWERLAGTGE